MTSIRQLLKIPPLGPIPKTLKIINDKLAELHASMSSMHIELADDRDDGGELALVFNVSTKCGQGFAVRTTEPTDVLKQIALNIDFTEALQKAVQAVRRCDDDESL